MFTATIVRLAVTAAEQGDCAKGKCVTGACSGGGGVFAGPIYVGNSS